MTKTELRIPKWVYESHLREIEDLADMGEYSEAKEVLQDGKQEWRGWCGDCSGTTKY